MIKRLVCLVLGHEWKPRPIGTWELCDRCEAARPVPVKITMPTG